MMEKNKKRLLLMMVGGGGREDCGWRSANLSGTYSVIVIRPQLSRTATTRMGDASDRSVAVLNRPTRINTISLML
jgi:hypothetical protein